jgi:transcriptional regulator
MRHTPAHAVTDPDVVRTLIAENPWATIVSLAGGELVASHYPVLLEDGDDLAVVTHLGRPDERIHGLGAGAEVLVIFAGPHGYISPSWYSPEGVRAPTWNFSVAHCHGVPEVLSPEDNVAVLKRLVARFESAVAHPVFLEDETAERLAPGTVGIRIPIARFACKVKLSQDKDPASQAGVLAALRAPGPYANPALADAMERELSPAGSSPGPASRSPGA